MFWPFLFQFHHRLGRHRDGPVHFVAGRRMAKTAANIVPLILIPQDHPRRRAHQIRGDEPQPRLHLHDPPVVFHASARGGRTATKASCRCRSSASSCRCAGATRRWSSRRRNSTRSRPAGQNPGADRQAGSRGRTLPRAGCPPRRFEGHACLPLGPGIDHRERSRRPAAERSTKSSMAHRSIPPASASHNGPFTPSGSS